jgi:GntR family transcriptional regulator
MPLLAGPLPKHYQLSEILRGKILAGELGSGERLPGEYALCREYQISRGTVRKALGTLAHEGYIYSEQGRGAFVSLRPRDPLFFTLSTFDEEICKRSQQPASRWLSLQVRPASTEAAGRLGLPPGEPVIWMERLRQVDGRPVAHEIRCLAQSLCPELLQEDLESQSIHSLLVHKYHLPLLRARHTIEARTLTPGQAALLEAEPGAPAFFVDRLTDTRKLGRDLPAVWFQALHLGTEYSFRVEFEP